MGNVNALLKSHCHTKTHHETHLARAKTNSLCGMWERKAASARGNPHQCMKANAHKVENGISAKVKCKAQGTHTQQRQNRWEREGCMCACVCDTQRERLEWKCRCNRALFVYVCLPLTHTHTHSAAPAPLRAIMRRVCSCVRLRLPLPLAVPSSLSFTLFASFPVSVVFFLFSLIFSSVRACVSASDVVSSVSVAVCVGCTSANSHVHSKCVRTVAQKRS